MVFYNIVDSFGELKMMISNFVLNFDQLLLVVVNCWLELQKSVEDFRLLATDSCHVLNFKLYFFSVTFKFVETASDFFAVDCRGV